MYRCTWHSCPCWTLMLLLPHLTPSLPCFLDFTVVQAATTTDRFFPGSELSRIFSTPAGNEVNPESDIPSDPIFFSCENWWNWDLHLRIPIIESRHSTWSGEICLKSPYCRWTQFEEESKGSSSEPTTCVKTQLSSCDPQVPTESSRINLAFRIDLVLYCFQLQQEQTSKSQSVRSTTLLLAAPKPHLKIHEEVMHRKNCRPLKTFDDLWRLRFFFSFLVQFWAEDSIGKSRDDENAK